MPRVTAEPTEKLARSNRSWQHIVVQLAPGDYEKTSVAREHQIAAVSLVMFDLFSLHQGELAMRIASSTIPLHCWTSQQWHTAKKRARVFKLIIDNRRTRSCGVL